MCRVELRLLLRQPSVFITPPSLRSDLYVTAQQQLRYFIPLDSARVQQFHGRSPPTVDFESLAKAIRASSDPDPFNSADCRR
jgi:hypothetical protein